MNVSEIIFSLDHNKNSYYIDLGRSQSHRNSNEHLRPSLHTELQINRKISFLDITWYVKFWILKWSISEIKGIRAPKNIEDIPSFDLISYRVIRSISCRFIVKFV